MLLTLKTWSSNSNISCTLIFVQASNILYGAKRRHAVITSTEKVCRELKGWFYKVCTQWRECFCFVQTVRLASFIWNGSVHETKIPNDCASTLMAVIVYMAHLRGNNSSIFSHWKSEIYCTGLSDYGVQIIKKFPDSFSDAIFVQVLLLSTKE